jgi:putative solute:sodium symporter small subunit
VALLVVWFIAGYVMSIFFIEPLNSLHLGGLPLGFWMAQQGSIFVFVVLIFLYAVLSGRLDRQAGLEETDEATSGPSAAH